MQLIHSTHLGYETVRRSHGGRVTVFLVYHFVPCFLYLPKRPSSLDGVARDVCTNRHTLHFGHPKVRSCWKRICTDMKLHIFTIGHKNANSAALNVWFVKVKKDAAWPCEAADDHTSIIHICFTYPLSAWTCKASLDLQWDRTSPVLTKLWK